MADKALIEYFKGQELRQIEPWRNDHAAFLTQKKSFVEISNEEAQNFCLDMCKNAMMSAEEVMALCYLLFANDEGKKFFAQILMQKRGQDRITAHNWFIADSYGPTFLATHGPKISKLMCPLFPPVKEFHALNLKILNEPWATGAGGEMQHVPSSVYRQPSVPVGGAYTMSLQTAASGEHFVDATPIEEGFSTLAQRVQNLEVRLSNRGGRGYLNRGRGYRNGRGRGARYNPWGRGEESRNATPETPSNAYNQEWTPSNAQKTATSTNAPKPQTPGGQVF